MAVKIAHHRLLSMSAGLVAVMAAPVALAGGQGSAIGYDDLMARLGANTPTGAGVVGGQIEAPAAGAWAPDPANSHFTGIQFTFESPNPQFSGHATGVGRHFYGNVFSIAQDVDQVHAWEVNHWIGPGFLRFGGGSLPPLATPADVFNHSWIGNGGGANNEVLRRVDYSINTQDLLYCVGVGNGSGWGSGDILLSHAYNTITVGVSDGDHHFGDTLAGVDGPGRMKPEILVPEGTTSHATGVMSSCSAIMLETARTWPGLASNSNADEPEVIKAALLAGATHRIDWTNNPETSGPDRGVTTRPLDEILGVDQVNVNTTHMVLTGLEQPAGTSPSTATSVSQVGWDFDSISQSTSRFYRFDILTAKDEVSIVLTWNRHLANTQFLGASPPIANFDLELFDCEGNPLRGDDGIGVFGGGNIASNSLVDNIEHLFIRDLEPGAYALRVRRQAGGPGGAADYAVAWYMEPDVGGALARLTGVTPIFHDAPAQGGIAELICSDDDYYITNSTFGFSAAEANLTEIEFSFDGSHTSPASLTFSVEARLNNPGGSSTIRLFNFKSGSFQAVHSYSIGQEETVETVAGLSGDFVDAASGEIRARVRQSVVATFAASGFDSFWDEVKALTFE